MDEFGDKFDLSRRYTDYREMFEKEKPELVQVSTPPNVRLEVLEAAEAGGCARRPVVEKPLAIQGEDYVALRDFAAGKPKIKVAINSSAAVSSAAAATAAVGGRRGPLAICALSKGLPGNALIAGDRRF